MNVRDRLKIDEGYEVHPYKDTMGIWTGGVGRNFEAVRFSLGERLCLQKYGIDPAGVCDSAITLPDELIELMLTNDIDRADALCASIFPAFDSFSQNRQDAFVNMAFNLGPKIRGFQHMISAANSGDWMRAAVEAQDSSWYHQVGDRAVRICYTLKNG